MLVLGLADTILMYVGRSCLHLKCKVRIELHPKFVSYHPIQIVSKLLHILWLLVTETFSDDHNQIGRNSLMYSHSHDGETHTHSHEAGEHGHTHEVWPNPGSFSNREKPIEVGRNWQERAFTVGIGGYLLLI
jgi:hypothetical protein